MEDNITIQHPAPAGNDISDGDAREEVRMDKDEDLKNGDDKDSPLSEPFTGKKEKITPHSLSIPDVNHGHSVHNTGENEQPDPADEDAPESKINQ